MNGDGHRQGRYVFLLSGLIALLVAVWFFPEVFPISGLRIRVSRAEAAEMASRLLQQVGAQVPPGYTRATRFVINDGAKSYLEQKLGIAQANRVAQRQGFVYGWYTRWFRPGNERILTVTVDPEGRVLSFSDRLPTDAPAPPSRQPRRVAERFLQEIVGIDLQPYRLVGDYQVSHPARVDYSYLWERTDVRLAEARERIRVEVTGDRVIDFTRYLHYPESFTHEFRRHRFRGETITLVAAGATAVFGIALVMVLLFGWARRELRWRLGLIPAVLVTVVHLLNDLNTLPLQIASMGIDQTWGAFWAGTIATTLFGSLSAGVSALLIIIAADWAYRKAFPQAIPLQHWFTRRGWAHPEGKKRIALGYWLFAIHLLYIVVFLTGARRLLGAWASAIVPYDDLMSTAAPWAYPVLVAVSAAITEEFFFRVFLISLSARYLRSAWAGIVISAVVWSALHCSYPTVPYYLRAIELIPVGILLGWVVMRFGPLPTLISHAAYNAAVSSDIFLYNTDPLARLSFGVVALFILLPGVLAWWWSRQLDAAAPLETATQSEMETPPVAAEQTVLPEQPIEREVVFPSLGRRRLWLAVLALGVVSGLSYGSLQLEERQQRFAWAKDESNPLRLKLLDARQAAQTALQYLPQRGKEVRGWQQAVSQGESNKEEAYDYLRRFLSRADADALWKRVHSPDGIWEVRWWKTGTREEWWVLLTADGKFWERYCRLPEEAPGKKISKEEARRLAIQSLRELGFPLDRMRLVDSAVQEMPARSAHGFRWRVDGLQVGQAQFHLVVWVEGDVVTSIYRQVEAPSSYLFRRNTFTTRQGVAALVVTIVFLTLFIRSLWVHVRLMRQPGIPWKWTTRPALVVSLLPLLLLALNLPQILYYSPATLPPQAYLLATTVGVLVIATLLFFSLWQLAPYIPAWQTAFPDLPDPTHWWQALTRPRAHRRVWREAIVAQAAVWAGIVAVVVLVSTVELLALPGGKNVSIPEWLVQWHVNDTASAQGIASYSPALYTLVLGLLAGLLAFWVWTGYVIGLKVMFGNVRQSLLWHLLLLTPVALLLDDAWESVQYLVGILCFLGVVWLLYRWILRWNPLTLFVFGLHITLVTEGHSLLQYQSHRADGVLLWLIVVGFLLWALVDWWRERRQAQVLHTTQEPSPELE